MGRPPKVHPLRRPNPLSTIKPVRNPTPIPIARQAVQGASKLRRLCPNKLCTSPKVEDGVCQNCGTIIDESNIVAEVQFGENSSGAAVVQGSFVSADQGIAKSLGPAFRKAGGTEDREKTIREGRRIMQGFAVQYRISESVVNSGLQIFKLASMNNFIQGRRMRVVAAVCLYSACRKERPCRVMLIDFAEATQVNVFKLGHCFKALHEKITLSKYGILPVLPEDLIYRFASKLEFGSKTVDVAQHAVRLVGRLNQDWIVAGRRPAGICAAAIVMSARIHNFRRTTQDVEHIVKITWSTIQKRLDEFKRTASADLTVDDFIRNQFLESSHDPPSFYEKSAAFQAGKRKRKRKRALELGDDEDDSDSQVHDESNEEHERLISITASLTPELNTLPRVEYLRDAEGFIIPPPPMQKEIPIDPALLAEDDPKSLERLAVEHGDTNDSDSEEPEDSGEDEESLSQKRRTKSKGKERALVDWDEEDDTVEGGVSPTAIGDPNTVEHARAFAAASHRALVHIMYADALKPVKDVPMTEIIDESEFADDDEVENCLIPEAEATIKERIWVNANKDWILRQQQKEFQKQMEAMGPPKAKRKRIKKPRIGEGQTSAASTPAEAAVERLKERAWSKRINYDAIASMFDGPGATLGSAATSRITSRAGSTVASIVSESVTETGSIAQPSDAEQSDVGNMDDFDGEDLDDDWRKEFERPEDEE